MTKFRLSESKAKQAWTLPNVRNFDRRSKSRLLTLLALLLTAATGTWAQNAQNVYSNALNTTELFNSMTYIDVNGDATTSNGLWTILDNATYIYSSANAANDWLVTPGLVLEAGVTYTIAIDAVKPLSPSTYTETFEVKVGTAANADALSGGTAAIATTEVTTSWTTYQGTFTPTEDGTYYVGIHATSPANQSSFSIRNLSVDVKYYTVTLDDGAENPTTWKGKVGDATQFGNLPLEGVTEGQTVTLKYDGTREVKSITAKVEVIPVGAIKGKFTINNTGKQVYFAKGNLQAVCTSADYNDATHETFTWQFAENQWDCVGNNAANYSINGNGSVSAAGTVDLFGWSTADTYYGIHNSTTAGDYSGDFVDWGGNIGTGWRTLSKDEWDYLIFTRASGSKVNDLATTNARYTHATINTDNNNGGINGIILFPDGVTVNYSDASWGGINDKRNWNGATKCTTSQWNALAAKGFVFLPAAGYRNETTISSSNDNGYYWSSTLYSESYSYYTRVLGSNEEPTTVSDSRKTGISVRLVYDVK